MSYSVEKLSSDLEEQKEEEDATDYRFLKFKFPMESWILEVGVEAEHSVPALHLENTGRLESDADTKHILNSDSLIVDNRAISFDSDRSATEYESLISIDEAVETHLSMLDDCSSIQHPDDVSEDEYIELDLHTTNSIPENDSKKLEEQESVDTDGKLEAEKPDSDDEFGFEIIHEHQELIQQMKMELKQAKNRGLPTILEDCESPKLAEDMKPLMFNKKLVEHKDLIEDVQKFYKSYADKMRKLDILNQQTMNAMSLIRFKYPTQLVSMKKKTSSSPITAIRSVLTRYKRPLRVRCDQDSKHHQSVVDLNSKLELIYVGQLCLSWEILNWQFSKALELLELDPQGSRQYNLVAGEFQQFQVVLQRFLENEVFQGPRVQSYVEKRSGFRGFLQVPPLRDDCKTTWNNEGEYAMPIVTLVKIILESMVVFYEFLRSEKHEGIKVTNLQEQSDNDFLIIVQSNFHNKEKRLKELIRTKGFSIKKLHQGKEPRLSQTLFVAQVELSLVARVLSMSKVNGDQLGWCHKKLDEIKIIDRILDLEPTFSLFPC